MKKLKCKNNHFYDGDKYAECPHCKAMSLEEKKQSLETKKESSGWKIFKKKNSSEERDHTVLLSMQNIKEEEYVNLAKSNEDEDIRCDKKYNTTYLNNLQRNITEHPYLGETKFLEETTDEQELRQGQSLLEQVERVVQSSEPKTVGIWGGNINKEPVVGWLVCVQGPNQGESFELKAGKNNIGRSAMMDVIIEKDNKISREKHTVIMYEPKSKKYFVLPNEGTGMVYKNDEILMMPTELHEKDIIIMGDSRFLFIPLCGEKFTWEEWIES